MKPAESTRLPDAVVTGASRLVAIAAVVLFVGALPWLSGRSAEYTILRARYAELEATEENLRHIRVELGLDGGPLAVFARWAAGLARGDAGTSWISGTPVLPGVVSALGVSLTLMGFAVAVASVVAVALAAPALVAGVRGEPNRGSGAVAAMLTALPEFVLAAALLLLGSVWLGWFPPYGWTGLDSTVLPALALGVPAGGLMGRLLADAVTAASAERWTTTWTTAGIGRARVGAAILRRAVPSILGQVGLVLVGLTGGAVAVEQVFAIPGLGRATLGAASSQDIPTLQAGVLALLLIAVVIGVLVALGRRALLGPAMRAAALPVDAAPQTTGRLAWLVPVGGTAILAAVVAASLLRDPYVSAHGRLAPPSADLPFGADAGGRDLLARVGHGTVATLGTALAVTLVCFAIGLLVGMAPRPATGPIEVTNAAPPIIAGILVAALSGPSVFGAAIAVALVSWAPLAAHTAALVQEARARPNITVLPVLGVGPGRAMFQHVLPTVVGPVFRHAMLRLPGIALALAALGFLGLGPRQPSPEWGLLLAEGIGYAERAPWTVAVPTLALVITATVAVSASSLGSRR